jgi:hypothetical protein
MEKSALSQALEEWNETLEEERLLLNSNPHCPKNLDKVGEMIRQSIVRLEEIKLLHIM